MAAYDYKKEFKEIYLPPKRPTLIEMPPILYLMVDGGGAPEDADYQQAMKVLYSLSFTIKMSKMGEWQPQGYFEYAVPPLEGLWGSQELWNAKDRKNWKWTSMIRQPDFVTPEVLAWAIPKAAKKNPGVDYGRARLAVYEEGLCVQCMHIGPYSEEPRTLEQMDAFAQANGCEPDMAGPRRHHEVYLSNPLRAKPETMKTVLRHPVRRV